MRRFLKALAVLVVLFSFAAPAVAGVCDSPVDTAQGAVIGMDSGAGCAWLGLPYAAPPVGGNRFRPPQPVAKRSGEFKAIEYGPGCVQNANVSAGGKSKTTSEDCLSLNIWRPQKSGPLPVMLFIHGGSFTAGSGSYDMYNGARLAEKGEVVVVTINYRLGPFGFLALPELAAEDGAVGTGNMGLLDQVTALQWVRDNITAFGGDPKNVTIFGESAGAVSVCSLLGSPLASGLFHRAIMQSGACDLTQSLPDGYARGRQLAVALGCPGDDARDCLRQKPVADILKAAKEKAASPHLDGRFLADQPINLIRAGKWNAVPVMTGYTRDEMAMLFYITPGAMLQPRGQVEALVRKMVPSRADDILGLYSFNDYREPIRLFGAVIADAFGSRALQLAQAASATQPAYWYRFDWDEQRGHSLLGSFHGLELPFVFGNFVLTDSPLGKLMPKKSIPEGRKLSDKMIGYWSNFARGGNPNGPGLPEWKPVTAEAPERILLDTTVTSGRPQGQEWKRLSYFAGMPMSDFDTSSILGE